MVRNASGESACHDALIGADGMDSRVRQLMEKHGYSQFHRNDFPFSYKEIGLTLSVPSSTPEGLHIWPRGAMMLIGLPTRMAGQLDGTLFLPQDMQADWFASKAALDARWAEQFPDVPLTSLEASNAVCRPTGRIHTIQGGPWHAGRVVLVGDAAHAMTPFLGQGMNCTFEDCETLLAHIDSATDPATAFSRFSASRHVGADAIGRLSVSNLEEMMCKSPTPEYAYQKNLEALLMTQFPDTFTSCYAAITFSSTPYAKVLRMRHLQEQLMQRIAKLGWQDATPEAID